MNALTAFERARASLGHALVVKNPVSEQYIEQLQAAYAELAGEDGFSPNAPEPVVPLINPLTGTPQHTTCSGNTFMYVVTPYLETNPKLEILYLHAQPSEQDATQRAVLDAYCAISSDHDVERRHRRAIDSVSGIFVAPAEQIVADAKFKGGCGPGWGPTRWRTSLCAAALIALEAIPGEGLPSRYEQAYDDIAKAIEELAGVDAGGEIITACMRAAEPMRLELVIAE